MLKTRFTVSAGRQIELDGEPFVSIVRDGTTTPVTADDTTHLLCSLLNRSRHPTVKKALAEKERHDLKRPR